MELQKWLYINSIYDKQYMHIGNLYTTKTSGLF